MLLRLLILRDTLMYYTHISIRPSFLIVLFVTWMFVVLIYMSWSDTPCPFSNMSREA